MNPISAYRGSLNMYFQVELDSAAGTYGPAQLFGNLTSFELTPSAETVDVASTMNGDYGQTADSMTEPGSTTIPVTADRYNLSTMALQLLGDVVDDTAAESTVSDQDLGTVAAGDIVNLGALGVSAVTISDGSTPIDAAKYDVIEPALGLVQINEAGTYTASYTIAAKSGSKITGGTSPAKKVRLLGRGVNQYNNKETIIKVSRASVATASGFTFVGTDNAEVGITITALLPADGSAAFEVYETGK